ncbi:MAG: imidazole glycerol phosphate synthase subunit HisH [Gemmatimonadaceae bacterium]
MNGTMIGIANLDIGNLRSVSNAVDSFGYDHCLVETAAQFESLSHLILPGVGSFHAAMSHLHKAGMHDPIREFAASGRPLLGICLGMQLLGSAGDEGVDSLGLGLIPGQVRRFDRARVDSIPHIGWNSVEMRGTHPVFDGVRTGVDFYFVHSYHLEPDNVSSVLAVTYCGERFVSAAAHANVVGLQFHPEKSQANGLRLLDNFCGWDGRC